MHGALHPRPANCLSIYVHSHTRREKGNRRARSPQRDCPDSRSGRNGDRRVEPRFTPPAGAMGPAGVSTGAAEAGAVRLAGPRLCANEFRQFAFLMSLSLGSGCLVRRQFDPGRNTGQLQHQASPRRPRRWSWVKVQRRSQVPVQVRTHRLRCSCRWRSRRAVDREEVSVRDLYSQDSTPVPARHRSSAMLARSTPGTGAGTPPAEPNVCQRSRHATTPTADRAAVRPDPVREGDP